ncbi:hypothetical protein BHU62_12005 [Serratia marcescens]|uniref:Uncharacterized protein n=1 Tax=Serratia marcescens TaxID=615 RepID=A0A1Q4P0H9_SERMA|nr:hypothetical protein [Serratia marcescens]OKB66586.1 hypothetical protein BHU62_12005 [Serratia marcescens]
MSDNNSLPHELDFITHSFNAGSKLFHSAEWLNSQFDDPVWATRIAQNSKKDTIIDFRVRLNDGLLLTHPRHQSLLESIKSYLCLSSHSLTAGGIQLAPRTIEYRIHTAIGVIDYFLLRSERFQLASHGFKSITPHEVTEFMAVLAVDQYSKSNLYAVREELRSYLRFKSQQVTKQDVQRIISKVPGIAVVDDAGSAHLGLSESEIISARIFLWINGNYKHIPITAGNNGHLFFKHQVSPSSIYTEIYHERTLVTPKFLGLALDELHFDPSEKTFREYPMVPSMALSGDPLPSEAGIDAYRQALKRMEFLKLCGLDHINPQSLAALENKAFLNQLKMKSNGRYRTLPREVIFSSFRNAVEFYFELGQPIIDGYLTLAREADSRRCTLGDFSSSEIGRILPQKLRDIGVRVWDLSSDFRGANRGGGSALFFSRFRANEGLFQLVEVLYGAIWIILSALSARRSGEIRDLVTTTCLVKKSQGYYLQFDLRKRNFGRHRELTLRPIPNVVAQCILSLTELHQKLSTLNSAKASERLFSKPQYREVGLSAMGLADTAKVLNRFSDYFEAQLDSAGRRYYVRTHQMRRFFAMTFFWAGGFGGLDTLRWFLGHTHVEHVYHYITEVVPGEVLRRVGAEYASEALLLRQDNTKDLEKLLNERYGLSSFSIMQSDEVADYIEDLIKEGAFKVEPVFIDTPTGQRHEIIFKIIGDNA